MSANLKKLFVVFGGDTRKIAWFLAQFKNELAFVQALEDAEWKIGRLEKTLAEMHKGRIDKDEVAIQAGAAKRASDAEQQADDRAYAASIGHTKVQDLLATWYVLDAECKARGYDKVDALPVDLSYLEMGTSSKVGDAAALKFKTFSEELLGKEPLVQFSNKVGDFLTAAREGLAEVQGDVGLLHSYTDSLAEAQRLITQAETLSARLADLFNRSAPQPRPMRFAEQSMVPSAKDLTDVQRTLTEVQGISTPSQAWALTGADKKGADEKALYRVKAVERLAQLNKAWGTSYQEAQLDGIMHFLVSGRITTNYFLSDSPGANLDQGGDAGLKPTPLVELLMSSKNFLNLWETGKSQASADTAQRGGVEERMGYGTALKRTAGVPQTRSLSAGATFDPADKSEMPKYAAVTSEVQTDGVAARYGKSFVVWKEALRQRVTHTPGDSWNMTDQGVGFLTSGKHPEVIFANAEEILVRLAAAQATGKDAKWLAEARDNGVHTNAYIETQIHGDLTWGDVAEIQVGEDNADEVIAQLQAFCRKEGHDFKVRRK